ncbi:TPA: hypothetical protein DCE37_16085 [Candidatus Latescibacteria bacterium]|nr:hypothetical protein [Candidatus Latescibacterota bacterium]
MALPLPARRRGQLDASPRVQTDRSHHAVVIVSGDGVDTRANRNVTSKAGVTQPPQDVDVAANRVLTLEPDIPQQDTKHRNSLVVVILV